MGYGLRQVQELEETIARTPCDLVLVASPVDLRRVLRIKQPSQRVQYELREISPITLSGILKEKFGEAKRNAGEDLTRGTSLVPTIEIRQ
jgi:predicted GTPase